MLTLVRLKLVVDLKIFNAQKIGQQTIAESHLIGSAFNKHRQLTKSTCKFAQRSQLLFPLN